MTYELRPYWCKECKTTVRLVLADGTVGVGCDCTSVNGEPFIRLGTVHGGLPEAWSR